MKNSLPTSDTIKKSPEQQREELLRLNNDLIFGVYDINKDFNKYFNKGGGLQDGESSEKIKLTLLGDTLACYPNQVNNLKGLDENPDILIIDLNELRKGKFKILAGNKHDDILFFRENGSFKAIGINGHHTINVPRNLCLLSNGVIELIDSKYTDKNGKTQKRTHTFTTLRDGGAADALHRTCVAGRNCSDNLTGDGETEYTEENPFLQKIDGKYYLFTPKRSLKGGIRGKIMSLIKNKSDIISDLTNSVEKFLKTKYNLNRNNPNDIEFITMFEKNFKGIKYEELGNILLDIIKNKQIKFLNTNDIQDLKGLEGNMQEIEITDFLGYVITKGRFFVYYDKANNSFEYRSLRKIELPKGINPRQRLFLESQNQYAKTHRLESLTRENLVPTMKYFADKVKEIIK